MTFFFFEKKIPSQTLSTSPPPPAAKAMSIQQRHSLELKSIDRSVNLDEGYILILRSEKGCTTFST